MKNNLFKLNKLLMVVLFLLFLPLKMVAENVWALLANEDTQNPIVQTVKDPADSNIYTGSFTISNTITNVKLSWWSTSWYNYYGPATEEDFAIGKRVACIYQQDQGNPVAMPLPPGKYDIILEDKQSVWPDQCVYITITQNDGSLNYLEYGTDGVNWTKAETDGFSLPGADYAAGDKLYLRHVYKNKDGEPDQTTYTYYYGGMVPAGLADDATASVSLTCRTGAADVADMPYLTFEAAGKYSVDALTIDGSDRTKATVSVSRIGFRPTFPTAEVNYKITHDTGTDTGTAQQGTEITIKQNSDIEFSITGTTEDGGTTTYTLYPTEARELSNTGDKERTITFSTDERYKGNYLRSFHAAKFIPTKIECGEGELTMTYKHQVEGAADLARVMLFDGSAVPTQPVPNRDGKYLSPDDVKKEVMLRYDGDLTYSGVITLTQDDIDNNVLTLGADANWNWNRGYMFSTSTDNTLLRGEPSSIALGGPSGTSSWENGMLHFGSRFTPGIYRITVKGSKYALNTSADFEVPCHITLVPACLVYYKIEDQSGKETVGWRESVGVGVLRKFNYTDDEVSSKRIRPEFNARKLYIRTDLVDGNGFLIVTHYTGTVEFSDEEAVGTVKTFRLQQTADPGAGITVNAKGQFMMSFDRNTGILTVTRVEEAPMPVRGAVAVDKGAEKGKYTIIPVGGKLTVHVTEAEATAKAGTTFRFAANYDTYLTEDSYSARIYPAGDVVFGDKDYEFYRFDDAHSGTVTARLPGYYTFTARVYPKLNQVLIACQYTSYDPAVAMKADFSDAVFGKYPYVKGGKASVQKSHYNVDGEASQAIQLMNTYMLRGVPLESHNKVLRAAGNDTLQPLVPLESSRYNIKWKYGEINGERLEPIEGGYKRGELVRGNRYTMESVEDLFGIGGVIGCDDPSKPSLDSDGLHPNFKHLVDLRNEGRACAQGRLEAKGGRVSFVVQWTSTMTNNRLCYFYVTPDMRRNIIDRYKDSQFVAEVSVYDAFDGIGDDESAPDYLDGLYTKCLIAAINDGIIPGFGVLNDISRREAVKWLDLKDGNNNRYKYMESNNAQNLFNNRGKARKYYADGCWIEGARIPLAYFGEDYRGEESAEFPEGTYIYPYIISGAQNACALPYGEPENNKTAAELESMYTNQNIKFSDNRLNLMTTGNARAWSKDELSKSVVSEFVKSLGNYGCPAAMTFNYRQKNLLGNFIDMTLVCWEDQGSSIESDWSDIVLNVDGVKPVFDKPFTSVDFDVDACPDAEAQTERNTYTHIISLKPKTTALGKTEWTMDYFGTPYTVEKSDGTGLTYEPSYSYINVYRDKAFIGQIVFKKGLCQEQLDTDVYKTMSIDAIREDTKLHSTLKYFFCPGDSLLHVKGSSIVYLDGRSESDVEGWTEIFHEERNNGYKKVDISRVRFKDSFVEPFGHSSHAYTGSFYSASALVNSDPDEVIVPGSELTVSAGTGSRLPAEADYKAKAITALPQAAGEGGSSAAIVVSRNLNLAGKEVITSYDIYKISDVPVVKAAPAAIGAEEAAAQNETLVASVVPTFDSADFDPFDAFSKDRKAVITPKCWSIENAVLTDNSAEVEGDTYQVELGSDVITGGNTYRVKVNTKAVPVVAEVLNFECGYKEDKTSSNIPGLEGDVKANTYGAEPAEAGAVASALRLTVPDPEKGTLRFVDTKLAVTYATTPSWTIDLSAFPGVEPGDVKYYLWRRYTTGNPAFEAVDGKASDYYLPTLFANESTPGMIPADAYQNWSWADQNIDLTTEGSTSSLSDVLVTDYVGDAAYAETGQPLAAEYTLYAYIPAYEKAGESAGPAAVKARSYGEQTAATRYYVLKATAPVETTNMEVDVLTGIEDVASGTDGITVAGAHGVLTVTGARRVSVYTVSGFEVYAAEGDMTATLPAGIYVVKADSKVVKISL